MIGRIPRRRRWGRFAYDMTLALVCAWQGARWWHHDYDLGDRAVSGFAWFACALCFFIGVRRVWIGERQRSPGVCNCPVCKKEAAFLAMPFGAGRLGELCPYCAMVGGLVASCGTCNGTGRVVVPASERGAP